MQWHRRPRYPRAVDYRVGTMGFGYPDWNGTFYPRGLTGPDRLAFYAKHFDAIELDSTYHAIPAVEAVDAWRDATPPGFLFTAKMSKAVTHSGVPLTGAGSRSQTLLWLDTLTRLGEKLACCLIQFPASFAPHPHNLAGLDVYLHTLPAGVRYAVEFRHDGWWTRDTADLLKSLNVSWVVADEAPHPVVAGDGEGYEPRRAVLTGDLFYARFIGVHEQFEKKTHQRLDPAGRLGWWAERLRKLEGTRVTRTLCFFNNDYAGHSPDTARQMRRALGLPELSPPVSLFAD